MLILEFRDQLKIRLQEKSEEIKKRTKEIFVTLTRDKLTEIDNCIDYQFRDLEALLFQDLKDLEKNILITISQKRNGV